MAKKYQVEINGNAYWVYGMNPAHAQDRAESMYFNGQLGSDEVLHGDVIMPYEIMTADVSAASAGQIGQTNKNNLSSARGRLRNVTGKSLRKLQVRITKEEEYKPFLDPHTDPLGYECC